MAAFDPKRTLHLGLSLQEDRHHERVLSANA
jgi:hypothetical protein